MPKRFLPLVLVALSAPLVLGVVACSKPTPPAGEEKKDVKTYTTKGAIKSFGPDKKFVNVAHENIPGYMAAMTMSFEPKTPAQLDGLSAGDKVSFSFSDEGGRRVIVSIKKEP